MKLFEKLSKEQEKYLAKLLAKTEAKVTDIYRAALVELKGELLDLASRYNQKGFLVASEMNRFKRYSAMMDSIRGKIADAMGISHAEMRKTVVETYLETRGLTAYAMDQTAGGTLGFGRVDPKDLEKAVNDKYSKLADSRALEGDKLKAFSMVKNQINLSMARGEDVGTTSNRVAEVLGFKDKDGTFLPNGRGELYKAMRIARTETHRVQSQGQVDTIAEAKDLGVDLVMVWDAALDDRTRDTHGEMDGQIADENGEFTIPGGALTKGPSLSGIASEDINCRCVARPQVKGFPPSVRRVGDGTKPWQSYKEWKDEREAKEGQPTPEIAVIQTETNKVQEEPQIRFEPQQTVAEAEKWAVEKNMAEFVSYKGADIEVANAWNESVFNHLVDFPELKNNFRFIGTTQERQRKFVEIGLLDIKETQSELYKKAVEIHGREKYEELLKKKLRAVAGRTPANTYAYANYDKYTKGVQVNSFWASDPTKFKKALGDDVKSGWHPVGCDTIKSVIDHEIGHQLDDLLGIEKNQELVNILEGRDIKSELSKYAMKNTREIIAEAWAEYKNNPNPRPIAIAIAKLIEREYNLRYGKDK